jgi:hypothetical protein
MELITENLELVTKYYQKSNLGSQLLKITLHFLKRNNKSDHILYIHIMYVHQVHF